MAFTDALDVSIGAATKASDYDSLADNTEFNREKTNAEHDLDISTGAGKHKSIGFLNSTDVIALKAGSASLPALTAEGDLNTGRFFPAADTIADVTAGTERTRLTPSGAFGIGNAAAITTAKLQATSAIAIGLGNADPASNSTQVFGDVGSLVADNTARALKQSVGGGGGAMYAVMGGYSTNWFCDLICTAGGAVSVISSTTVTGAPAARSYSVVSENIKLTINDSSQSYSITIMGLGINELSSSSAPSIG